MKEPSLPKETSLRKIWEGMNLLKDCEDIYEELEDSDIADHIRIMFVNVWNGLKKIDDFLKEGGSS